MTEEKLDEGRKATETNESFVEREKMSAWV